jgi:hypothetical protein
MRKINTTKNNKLLDYDDQAIYHYRNWDLLMISHLAMSHPVSNLLNTLVDPTTFLNELAACASADRPAFCIINSPELTDCDFLKKILNLLDKAQILPFCRLNSTALRRVILTPDNLLELLLTLPEDLRLDFFELAGAGLHITNLTQLTKFMAGLGPELAQSIAKAMPVECYYLIFKKINYKKLRAAAVELGKYVSNIYEILSQKLPVAYFSITLENAEHLCDWISQLNNKSALDFCQRFDRKFFLKRIRNNENNLQKILLLFQPRDRSDLAKLFGQDFWNNLIDSPIPLGKTLYTLSMREALNYPGPVIENHHNLPSRRRIIKGFCLFITIRLIEEVLYNFTRLYDVLEILPQSLILFFVALLTPAYQQRIILETNNSEEFMNLLAPKDKVIWSKVIEKYQQELDGIKNAPADIAFFPPHEGIALTPSTQATKSNNDNVVVVSKCIL